MKILAASRSAFLTIIGAALVLAGCSKKDEAPPPPTAAPATAPVKSAEENSFDEVSAQLDPGGSFYAYLSTEQWLSGLAAQLAAFRDALISPESLPDENKREDAERALAAVEQLIIKSGIQDVTGFGASSIAIEPGLYRNKVFIHHHPGNGDGFLWSAFGKAAHPLDALALLPADTALASFADGDLALLVNVVREQVAASESPEAKQALDMALMQFSMIAGMTIDEALASLGGAAGAILTLDPSKPITLPMAAAQGQKVPTPRLALFFKVNDERIFNQIDATLGQTPGVERVDEPDLKMRTMALPASPEFVVRPTAAQWGGWLIIASDDKLVRDVIAAKESGAGFVATPEFRKLAEGLPAEGNGFQLMTETFSSAWTELQRGMIASSQPSDQSALVEKLLSSQKSGPAYAVWTRRPDGWLAVGKSSQGVGQMAGPLMIAPVAVLAGIAMPVFSSVGKKGKATKSLSKAKQIGLGCKLWAIDHDGAFPPSLDVLVPDYMPSREVFVSPFAPDQPMGYTYHAGLTETAPSETVLLEDTFAPAKGYRVIVHTDISGEVVPIK